MKASATKKAKATPPASGKHEAAPFRKPDLNELAMRALGGGFAEVDDNQVLSHLDAISIDLEVLHLAMTNEVCDPYQINNFVDRLIDRVRVVRALQVGMQLEKVRYTAKAVAT